METAISTGPHPHSGGLSMLVLLAIATSASKRKLVNEFHNHLELEENQRLPFLNTLATRK